LNISLPELMRNWVQTQIESGQYASSSDYVRDLIRRDQQKREKVAALQEAITAGLESGELKKLPRMYTRHFYAEKTRNTGR